MEPSEIEKNPFEGRPGGDAVKYPVRFELKVIFNAESEEKIHRRNLELVLEDSNVKYLFKKSVTSAKGSFVSITSEVVLENQHQLHRMYEQLKLLPGIRFAI